MKKNTKLPAVLIISLILIFIETAGAYFSKSLALFGYSGLILAISFSALPFITTLHGTKNDDFTKSQFRSIILNAAVLFILSLFIINKALVKIGEMPEIVFSNIYPIAAIGFIGTAICFLLLFKEKKQYSALLLKYFIVSLFAIFVIILNTNFLDAYIGIFFAVLMAIQAIFLFIKCIKTLRIKF